MIRTAIYTTEAKEKELTTRLIAKTADEFIEFVDIAIDQSPDGFVIVITVEDITGSQFQDGIDSLIKWLKKFGDCFNSLDTASMSFTINLMFPVPEEEKEETPPK